VSEKNYLAKITSFWAGAAWGACVLVLMLTFFSQPNGYAAFLHEYQTMVGAFVTLIAGYLAWNSVNRQTQAQTLATQRAEHQQATAARAYLAFHLDSVFSYSSECADYIRGR
jgi:threonine/homoserine/homoserine lactone efflux protein